MLGTLRRFRCRWGLFLGLAWALLLGTPSAGPAQAPKANGEEWIAAGRISLSVRVEDADPFALSNAIGAKADGPLKVRRGDVFRVTITGKLKPEFHTYPLVGLPKQEVLSKLAYPQNPALAPLWPVRESEPVLHRDKAFGLIKQFESEFQWSQDVLVLPDAAPGQHALKITVDSQACHDIKGCVPFAQPLEAVVEVSTDPPISLTAELEKRRQEKAPSYAVVRPARKAPSLAPGAAPGAKPTEADSSKYLPDEDAYRAAMKRLEKEIIVPKALLESATGGEDAGLLAFILAGVFWGAVSLVTPCVFPMIPITVSFFLKQSEKEHHKPLTMALVYCATIILVLTIAAVALLQFFQALSVNPWTNFGLGALFIFFALSLFGMYEIELPSGLARFTSEREGKGGLIGTIFMALTFTIISFACVAPFLGGFGGTAAAVQRPLWHTILGGLAFSATFAAPFFILALFPTLLRKMPKSGSWLNSVKVVMGFLELAAAVKFLRAGELAVTTTAPSFFTFDFSLGLYVAVCLLCGLYLLGVYRLPHDTPAEHLSVPRLMFSLLFLGLGLYLAPALLTHNAEGERQRPAGVVYAWVDSFLLPDFRPEAWSGNLDAAVARAREHRRRTGEPKYVFVDFTGKLCTNCKANERDVFSKPDIKALFQPYELVQIYTDYVPAEFYSPEERGQFARDNSRLRSDAVNINLPFQEAVFNTVELPQYIILEPRLDNTIRAVGVRRGLLNHGDFAEFLRAPQPGAPAPVAQVNAN
ncbi:MAG: thioredoxin family protein [Gemmataceae bacterium]|nr:thioredoxin family protein [Gemmataceae bacterium]